MPATTFDDKATTLEELRVSRTEEFKRIESDKAHGVPVTADDDEQFAAYLAVERRIEGTDDADSKSTSRKRA